MVGGGEEKEAKEARLEGQRFHRNPFL